MKEQQWFMNKVSCAFAVTTHDVDCHTVTKELAIQPQRFFNKGEKFTIKYSQSIGYRIHGVWAIESKPVIGAELNVSAHIQYFQELLGPKIEVIEKLKNQYHFECVFFTDIETNNKEVRYKFSEAEFSFIAKIASRHDFYVRVTSRVDY